MVGPLPQHVIDNFYNGKMVHCSYIHDHSCEMSAFIKFFRVFFMALRMYGPIHGIPSLIFKWNRLTKEPIKIIKKCIFNILRSSLFLATYVSVFHYFICRSRNYRKLSDIGNIVVASFFCSFAQLIEPVSRRTEVALFMFPRFLESMHLAMVKRGLARSYNNAEILIFSLAMSVMMYCYQNDEKHIKASYLSMFKKFFKTN